jgi:hypothetical protein
MIVRTACAVVLVSAFAGTVGADPIHIQAHRRINGVASIVDDTGFNGHDSFGRVTDAMGLFDATGAATAETDIANLSVEASQHTIVDATGHFSGSGSIAVHGSRGINEIDASVAESELAAQFALTRAMFFHFTTTMSVSGDAVVQAFIEPGPTGRALDAFPIGEGTPTHIERSGLLTPGSYLFLITANTGGNPTLSAAGSFDFDFSLQDHAVTPEPASLMLVALGGAAIFARRRNGTAAA